MSKKFATLASMKNAGNSEPRRDSGGEESGSASEDEGRQGFYVGGSERSGQQVLGPRGGRPPGGPPGADFQDQFFTAARAAGAEPVPPSEEASASGGGRNDVYRFPSTGYRLGDHVESGQRIGGQASATNSGAAAAAQRPEIDIRLLMWENGFSIEDGPLRTFADPANQEFLRTIMSGKVPAELVRGNPGKVVNLRMERRSEPYKAPKSKPFSGTGCRLGDVVPNVVGAGRIKPEAAAAAVGSSISPLEEKPVDLSAAAQSEVTLKEGEPVAQVQIRLPDGQRLVARFNASHTVTDIRSFIVSARPDLAYAPFQLLTTFPNRVIVDENANLKAANLMNAVVVVKPTTG